MRMSEVESRTGAVFDAEVAPSPVPARQTGRADFPHPAFRQASLPGPRQHQWPPSPCSTASSEVFRSLWCCQAHRQSPTLDLFKSTPEARVLPSTGITRLRRYYDPLRLPPGAHRRGYGAQAPPQWVSHVARITFPTCRAHYPGGPDGASVDLLPHPYCLPRSRRVGIRNCTFEACSGFIRIRPIGSLDRPRRPFHEAPAPPVFRRYRSSATSLIDFSLGGSFLHW